jgi:thymidylate synthase (FAD)
MKIIKEPEVFLVAKTMLTQFGLSDYLKSIGDPAWKTTVGVSDAEMLIEASGRLCYRSWQPYDETKPDATNKNVKKVREGNDTYLKNIIESGHGATLEHASATFIWKVSRVTTHEVCRHRAGMAYSQESLRYVRLDDLNFWMPSAVLADEALSKLFMETVISLEAVQKRLAEITNINSVGNFHLKKKLTSVFRRLGPMGLGTAIMITGNLRAWRNVIEQRTSEAAEEEIRIAALKTARILKDEYPNLFFDMTIDEETGVCSFANHKV